MPGHKVNSEFCAPKTPNVPGGNVERKQNSLFPAGPVFQCFIVPPNSKNRKKCEDIIYLISAGSTNLPRFQGASPITCELEFQVIWVLTHDTTLDYVFDFGGITVLLVICTIVCNAICFSGLNYWWLLLIVRSLKKFKTEKQIVL